MLNNISSENIQNFECPYCEENMSTTINKDGVAWTKCDSCNAILVADDVDDMLILISSIKRSIA